MHRLLALALATTTAACGFGLADDSSGGRDDLPQSGAGPFKKLEVDDTTAADEPWIATDPVLELTEAALTARPGGGHVVYVTREPAAEPAGDTTIWRAELPDRRELPTPFVEVLTADRTWEEGHVGAPAIVREGDVLVMFYAAGIDSVGRADSIDGGLTWTKWPAPVLTGITSPAIGYDGATWLLAFIDETGAIGLARSDDGHEFTRAAAPILTARTDDPGAFDHVAVAAPSLAWLVEGTGRGHWALWYAGLEESPGEGERPLYAIGYAASWDGASWSRLPGNRPIAAAPATEPTVALDDNHGVMAYTAPNGRRQSIGLAVTP